MRKGNGQTAKLSYGGHVLMENRNGLCVDILVTESTQAEHRAARSMLTRARRRRIHPKTQAADKGYHVKDFVGHLRGHQTPRISPESKIATRLDWMAGRREPRVIESASANESGWKKSSAG